MVLQRIEREVALNGGMDVKQSTELQDETTMRAVTNLRWDALGELRKRPTYASSVVPSPPDGAAYSRVDPEALFSREGEVFALTEGLGVVSVDPSDNDAVIWPDVDGLKYCPRACKVSRRFIERSQFASSGSFIYQVASAVYGSDLVVAWIVGHASGFSLCIEAFDVNTGQVVMQRNTVGMSATSTNLSIAAIPCRTNGSEGVLITYADGEVAPYSLRYAKYEAASRSLTSGILSSNSRFPTHAVAEVGDGVTWNFYLAFCDNTTGFLSCQQRTIGSVTLTHTGTLANPVSFAIVEGLTNTLLITTTSTNVYAERFLAPLGRINVFTASGETFWSATASLEDEADRAIVYVNCVTNTVIPPTAYYVRTASIDFLPEPSVDQDGIIPHTWTVNRAFSLDERSHVALTTSVFHEQPSVIICRYREDGSNVAVEPMARVGHDRFYSFLGGIYGDVYSTTVVDRKVHFVFMADPSEAGAVGSSVAPQALFHSTVEFPDVAMPCPSVEVDGVTHIATGLLVEWDGVDTSESTPLHRPRVAVQIFDVAGTGDGVVDNFTQSGTLTTLELGGQTFPTDVVGRSVTITGSTTPGNNGTFVVTTRVSDNEIRYTNAAGATELFGGNWSLSGAQGQTGDFSICAIYRRVNGKGLLVRSAPSATVTTGALTNQEIQVYVSRPMAAAYHSPNTRTMMEPEVYITEAGGTVHRLALKSTGEKEYANEHTDLWSIFATVRAGSSSAPALYTESGELAAEPTPALNSICRIGDLLWAIDAEDAKRVWISKPLVAGYGAEWNTARTMFVGDDGVGITDSGGTPTILGARGIWQVYGTGPDASGNGQQFAPAQKLPYEVGCIDRLLCRTSIGVVFRGRRGFYLLAGGLEPLGLPVDPSTYAISPDDYAYARIVFDEASNEIRIIDAEHDRYWVFNTLEKKWSEWTQDAETQRAVDAIVCRGRVWHLHYGESGALRREYGIDEVEDVSRSTESTSIEMPKQRISSILGRGLVRELHLALKVRAPGDETDTVAQVDELTVTYDTFGGGADATESFVWTGAQLAAMGSDDGEVLALQMRPRNQRCTGFRVTVSETCSGAYSGSSPVALRLVMGADDKAMRYAHSGARKGPA